MAHMQKHEIKCVSYTTDTNAYVWTVKVTTTLAWLTSSEPLQKSKTSSLSTLKNIQHQKIGLSAVHKTAKTSINNYRSDYIAEVYDTMVVFGIYDHGIGNY